MGTTFSPETPLSELTLSSELLAFATQHGFKNFADLLKPGLNGLHQLKDFNYRLQREVIHLVVVNKWDDLMETE
jgi:hypothetical protein